MSPRTRKSSTVVSGLVMGCLLFAGCSGGSNDDSGAGGVGGRDQGAGGVGGEQNNGGEAGAVGGSNAAGDAGSGSGGEGGEQNNGGGAGSNPGSGGSGSGGSNSGGSGGSNSGGSGGSNSGGSGGSNSGGSGGNSAPITTRAKFHVFGHSAFTYDGGDDAPNTPYTRAGVWLGLLADASGNESIGSFSWGQYENWNSYNWNSPNNVVINGVYDIGNTSQFNGDFPNQGYTHFISMPSNFLEADHGGPPYNNTVATTQQGWQTLDDNIDRYYPDAEHLIYVYFPDGGWYPVASNNNRNDFRSFNNDVMGDYLDWYIDLQDALQGAGRKVRTLPAGPVIAWLVENENSLSGLDFNDLFGDSAPHGSENVYLLAAMVVYRAIYGTAPNWNNFSVPSGANQILPAVRNNLPAIDAAIQSRLETLQANGVNVW